jgi:EAL domain-containing protein (putative c-di-GMP-specific phosphodiesterase class I)
MKDVDGSEPRLLDLGVPVPTIWASPLGAWLRGFLDDPTSTAPSIGWVFETLRDELEKAPVLGVLFVRLEYWGRAGELCGWTDFERVYRAVSELALDMMGKGLRRLDLPVDLGLHGQGLAVFLSAPRSDMPVELSLVDAVAERVAAAVRENLRQELDSRVAERISVGVGAGLFHRPEGDETLEEVVLSGLVAADSSSREKERRHLRRLSSQLEQALDEGRVGVSYQPVVDVGKSQVVGFEALPEGPSYLELGLGDVLLDVARRSGLSRRAYDTYHAVALAGAEGSVTGTNLLILHVSAQELLESAVRVFSVLFHRAKTFLSPANVIFLVEASEVTAHFPPVLAASRSLAEMGFKFGVNVASDGPLPLELLRELDPDLLRIGGRTVRGIGGHEDEFELVALLCRFAERHCMRVIAADCSEHDEVRALRRAGVDLLQGDLLAPRANRPAKVEVTVP